MNNDARPFPCYAVDLPKLRVGKVPQHLRQTLSAEITGTSILLALCVPVAVLGFFYIPFLGAVAALFALPISSNLWGALGDRGNKRILSHTGKVRLHCGDSYIDNEYSVRICEREWAIDQPQFATLTDALKTHSGDVCIYYHSFSKRIIYVELLETSPQAPRIIC